MCKTNQLWLTTSSFPAFFDSKLKALISIHYPCHAQKHKQQPRFVCLPLLRSRNWNRAPFTPWVNQYFMIVFFRRAFYFMVLIDSTAIKLIFTAEPNSWCSFSLPNEATLSSFGFLNCRFPTNDQQIKRNSSFVPSHYGSLWKND